MAPTALSAPSTNTPNSVAYTAPTTPFSSRPATPPASQPLPKIACFHGGGSNASIHKVQCSPLAATLKGRFELVFFDAPFVSERPGPDVLPAFKDYAPFRTWFKPLNKSTPDQPLPPVNTEAQEIEAGVDDGSGYNAFGTDGLERVYELMDNIASQEEWVGALGFSQGTRVVGGLLADQEARERLGRAKRMNLKFGVLCNGSRRPMGSEAQTAAKDNHFSHDDDSTYGRMNGHEAAEDKISIPSIHVHGLKDAQLVNGRIMKETFYYAEKARLLEIDYHHAMPWIKKDVEDLARMIMQA